MADDDGIDAKVIAVIAKAMCIDLEFVSPSKRLRSFLGADSLDLVEIVMLIEDDFDVEFPDEDCVPLIDGTVQEVIDAVKKKRAEKP